MKLFFSPGACSVHPHIVLNELGMKFDLEKVDLKSHTSKSGNYYKQNPKGYVPALLLDNGQLLTEGAAIVQYLADQKPEANLIPKAGTLERYRAIEWLNFIATELHKGFSNLWYSSMLAKDETAQNEIVEFTKNKLGKRFDILNDHFAKNKFLMGDNFTVADAYLYNILTWTFAKKIDLSKWTNLHAFYERVASRPTVKAVHETEKQAK